MDDARIEAPPQPSQDELLRLVEQANTGDEVALARLRTYLDKWPEISHRLGDLAQYVQLGLVGAIAGKNPLLKESITRRLDDLRSELIGTHEASPLEKLAIERLLSCWLHVEQVDLAYPSTDGLTPTTARFVVQLRVSAERRFDLASKSLATLRRLLAETPAQKRATLLRLHA